ncbi:MAG: serine O-acetyltransferase [Burkholderiales bacterium]
MNSRPIVSDGLRAARVKAHGTGPAHNAANAALAVEPLAPWGRIRLEAADVAEREPLLRTTLHDLVLASESDGDMLGRVLARKLCGGAPDEAGLRELIRRAFDGHTELLALVGADLLAVRARDPACTTLLHALVNLKGFHALQVHRVSHGLWLQARKELAHWLASASSAALGVDIHPAAQIGSGVMLDHGSGIVIGETAVIDDDVSILQNVTLGGTGKAHGDRHPKIRRGVMVGAGAKILGNIEVGTMSKVAAGSVVLLDVPPHCTVAGVPARIVRRHATHGFPAAEMNQSI